MKKKIIWLFVILLGLSWYSALSSMAKAPEAYKEHLNKAEDLEQRGVYIDAIEEYKRILDSNENDIDVMMRMADDYLLLGEKNDYIDTLKKAVEIQVEGSEVALDTLMEYFLENDEEKKAANYILELTDNEPKSVRAKEWLNKLRGGYRILYCNYDEMYGMYNNNMVVRTGDVYTIIDASGNRKLKSTYTQLTPFSKDGYARTINEFNKVVYINNDEYVKIAPLSEFTNLGVLNDSRIVASLDGKYGYLDESGEPVTDICWEDLTSFNKIGLAKKNGKWAIIESKGKEKTEYIYDGVIVDQYGIACNQNRVFVMIGDKYKLVDTKGNEVSELVFDNAKIFPDKGYAAVCINGKWGFIDAEGKLIIQNLYDDAESFSNGYAAVRLGELWGYIDNEGTMIIEPQFKMATSFSEKGTTAVVVVDEEEQSEKWTVIKLNINI